MAKVTGLSQFKKNTVISGKRTPRLLDWRCIPHFFEAQVSKRPDNIAVIHEKESLSYQELNQRANRLAHYLRKKGVFTEKLVAICVERNFNMVISVLAVLKAGGAYIPIDPDYPEARINYILKDSKASILLTKSNFQNKFSRYSGRVILLDKEQPTISKEPDTNLPNLSESHHLAYVIYTSGSTGNPKGVMIEHMSVINMILSQIDHFHIKRNSRILAFASFGFDASVSEIFTALCSGAALVLVSSKNIVSGRHLIQCLDSYHVTHATLPPSVLRILPDVRLKSLKVLISAGEACDEKIIKRWLNYQGRLINAYGPTEATVCTTLCEYSKSDKVKSVSIGAPIDNVFVYVLDDNQLLTEYGQVGELYIGGIGLARGYLNQQRLTQEKFTKNSFGGGRLYKTGDLVRRLNDGHLEFIGRVDNQIKIRGFRIESEEVEAHINKIPEIQISAVLPKMDKQGNTYLAAYFVSRKIRPDFNEYITGCLRKFLPEYMIPNLFIPLAKLPLTLHGKIDRKTLISLSEEKVAQFKNSKPLSIIEALLVEIWAGVLNIPKELIGSHDNFFELGGHSLLVHEVLLKVRIIFGNNLSISDFFKSPIVYKLANKIIKNQRKSKEEPIAPVETSISEGNIPLTHSQEQVWLHQQLAPDVPLFNEVTSIYIPQAIDIKKLERAINETLFRHDAFRIQFKKINDRLFQNIVPFVAIKLPCIDLQHLTPAKSRKEAIKIAKKEARKIFKFGKDPLFHFLLVRLSKTTYWLFTTIHHLIMDGVSMDIFRKDLEILYLTATNHSVEAPLSEPASYLGYASQVSKAVDENNGKQIKYWKNKLFHMIPTQLVAQTCMGKEQNYTGHRQVISLSKELSASLKYLCKTEKTTLFNVLFTAFNILLFKYTESTDIAIGTVISDRLYLKSESMFGNFLNTLILRMTIDENLSFKQVLKKAHSLLAEVYANSRVPFQEVLRAIPHLKQIQGLPFHISFVFEPKFSKSLLGWDLSQLDVHTETSKYDLTFELAEDDDSNIIGRIEYNTALFSPNFIGRMTEHYKNILKQVVLDGHDHIKNIELLTPTEKTSISTANDTRKTYDFNRCIHQLFEEQVLLRPNHIAVICGKESLSYQHLNQRANQLAHYLRKKGIGPDKLVAICVERNADMVISMLAVLKAGGAYIPIDPDYPKTRISYLLKDSRAAILLTQSEFKNKFIRYFGEVLLLDGKPSVITKEPNVNLCSLTESHHLAYVLYTSGSTGNPKGVMIEQAALLNHMLWMRDEFHFTRRDVFLQRTSYMFDASVWEFYAPLLAGGQLIIASDNKDMKALAQLITAHQVSIIQFTPVFLEYFLRENVACCHSIKKMFVGGDVLFSALVKKTLKYFKNIDLYNLYGPTEATIDTCFYPCKRYQSKSFLPIGKNIANIKSYVLDKNLNQKPIDIPGELYLSGVGLARGYLNQPKLTREKFIHNPFGKGKLYKTGDIVRRLQDGSLEFIERIDNQVKVRGFRVNLDEISSVLNLHPAIQESVVIVQHFNEGDARLVAYMVFNGTSTVEHEEIRVYLSDALPKYMVPSYFIVLDKLPINRSGKIDKSALTKVSFNRVNKSYREPVTDVHRKLKTVWEQLLDVGSVGIADDFFNLGGHSLLALQLLHNIQQQFGVELSLRDIFNYPTIQQLSAKIDEVKLNKNKKYSSSEAVEETLITLSSRGNKRPLFLVHPLGGTVFCFKNMVQYMKTNRPIYGIQDPCLHSEDKRFSTVEEMASFYVKAIKSVHPSGPYVLGGASSGGTIAIEMANQLALHGDQVISVILFDSWVFYPDKLNKVDFFRKNLQKLHRDWKKEFVARGIKKSDMLFELQWQRSQMLLDYHFSLINHPLVLFKAKQLLGFFESIQSDYNYWDKYSSKLIKLSLVPGDHHTMYHLPYVKILACTLGNYLARIE